MLIPARPDTQYWHDYILNGKADEVRFIRGRLKFTDEDGKAKDPAPFPSALVIWRAPDMAKRPTNCTTMDINIVRNEFRAARQARFEQDETQRR